MGKHKYRGYYEHANYLQQAIDERINAMMPRAERSFNCNYCGFFMSAARMIGALPDTCPSCDRVQPTAITDTERKRKRAEAEVAEAERIARENKLPEWFTGATNGWTWSGKNQVTWSNNHRAYGYIAFRTLGERRDGHWTVTDCPFIGGTLDKYGDRKGGKYYDSAKEAELDVRCKALLLFEYEQELA